MKTMEFSGYDDGEIFIDDRVENHGITIQWEEAIQWRAGHGATHVCIFSFSWEHHDVTVYLLLMASTSISLNQFPGTINLKDYPETLRVRLRHMIDS